MTPEQDAAVKLAIDIASAVFAKFDVTNKYIVDVRRHAYTPMPWIEINWCKPSDNPEDGENGVLWQEKVFMCETKEERTEIATRVYKTIGMMIGKLEKK